MSDIKNEVTPAASVVWPREVMRLPEELQRNRPDHLKVFLACPFANPGSADALFTFIQSTCDSLGAVLGAQIECVRADKLTRSGTIHADIWKHIHKADALIFDVTGENGNVLIELGVAAAVRGPDNVILLRERDKSGTATPFLFDIAPNRHLLFEQSELVPSSDFFSKLKGALLQALTPAPYVPPGYVEPELPLELDLRRHGDSALLLAPAVTHRRVVPGGLEFGSMYVFSNSWLALGTRQFDRIRVQAEIKFSAIDPNAGPGDGWIGISVLNHHHLANFGHLFYVRTDGRVFHTEPQDEVRYEDRNTASLKGFRLDRYVTFEVVISSSRIRYSIGGAEFEQKKSEVPFIRHAGRVRFQSYRCRAVIRRIRASRPR